MSSFLIFKCPMSHGTVKYTLKAHVCYFALMVGLLHYLYSLHPEKTNNEGQKTVQKRLSNNTSECFKNKFSLISGASTTTFSIPKIFNFIVILLYRMITICLLVTRTIVALYQK